MTHFRERKTETGPGYCQLLFPQGLNVPGRSSQLRSSPLSFKPRHTISSVAGELAGQAGKPGPSPRAPHGLRFLRFQSSEHPAGWMTPPLSCQAKFGMSRQSLRLGGEQMHVNCFILHQYFILIIFDSIIYSLNKMLLNSLKGKSSFLWGHWLGNLL